MSKLILWSFLLSLGMATAVQAECIPEKDSTDSVTHCKLHLDFYPRPIHAYFKPNHGPNYFVHFHGHNLDGYSHFDKRWGDYGQYLLNSGSEAVLVIPESIGKCVTYDTFFADPIKAKKFFTALENEFGVRSISGLSGHSGAYRVLNRLSGYANQSLLSVAAIGLFDATYAETPEIVSLVKEKSVLLYDAFVTGPKATAENFSRALKQDLKNEKSIFVPVEGQSQESLLEQHFMILKRGSLEVFFSKASAL